MSEAEAEPFTIEQFYRFVNEGKLMGAKCKKCGKIMLPPRPICIQCYSENLEWIKPVSYTHLTLPTTPYV